MKFVVPTRGRTSPIVLLDQLVSIRRHVLICCPPSERDTFTGWEVVTTECDTETGLPGKMQFIVDTLGEPFFKLDDDLRIYTRPSVTRQTLSTPREVFQCYSWCREILEDPANGAVNLMGKFGCNNLPIDRDKPYGSVRHAYGVRPDAMEAAGFRFDRAPMFVEDLDLCLSLLRHGYPVWTACRWIADEVPSTEARLTGGCQRIRTPERVIASFEALAERHEGFVRIGDQTSQKMIDHGFIKKLTCSWKKAYLAGGGDVDLC